VAPPRFEFEAFIAREQTSTSSGLHGEPHGRPTLLLGLVQRGQAFVTAQPRGTAR
jgi:hypothetical protein